MSTPQTASRLLEENAEFLRRLALALLGRHDEVEDVLQEVSVAALRNERVAVERGRPWLTVVLKNAARKVWRSNRRRGLRQLARAKLDEGRVADDAPSFVEQLEMARRLHDSVDKLPESQREAITLRYYQGMLPAAISKRLETPVETIRTRIKRGLSNLRATLGEEDERWRGRLLLLAAPGTLGAAADTSATATATTTATLAWWAVPAAAVLVVGAAAGAWAVLSNGATPGEGQDTRSTTLASAENAITAEDAKPDPGPWEGFPEQDPPALEASPEEPAPRRVKRKWPGTADEWSALVKATRTYLDTDNELHIGHLLMADQVRLWRERDYELLGDMPTLRRLVQEARTFKPQFDNAADLRQAAARVQKHGPRQYSMSSDDLSLGWALPYRYPASNRRMRKAGKGGPWPLLVCMLDSGDVAADPKWPARGLFARRYPEHVPGYPVDGVIWRNMKNTWLRVVPVADGGTYLDDQGNLDSSTLFDPLSQFWRRYHVDFECIVIDGGAEALAAATQATFMFAGAVLRSDSMGDDFDLSLLRNAHSLPLFVSGRKSRALVAALKHAGHKDVETGDDRALSSWLDTRSELLRVVPTTFKWTVATPAHTAAHWLVLDDVDWRADERELSVRVVDTKEEPNTIRIEARGIRSLSLLLNDEIVDLDRKVRVVINGHLMKDERPTRDFDVTFQRNPLKLRNSMMFSMMFPVRFTQITVKDRGPGEQGPIAGEPAAADSEK